MSQKLNLMFAKTYMGKDSSTVILFCLIQIYVMAEREIRYFMKNQPRRLKTATVENKDLKSTVDCKLTVSFIINASSFFNLLDKTCVYFNKSQWRVHHLKYPKSSRQWPFMILSVLDIWLVALPNFSSRIN